MSINNYLESLVGISTEIGVLELSRILNDISEEFNSERNQKGVDYVNRQLEEVKSIKDSGLIQIKLQKEKNFYSLIKPDNKTRYYRPASSDTTSATISAFYQCDKSHIILSDKEAATLKSERGSELSEEENKFMRVYCDEDQVSNNSNHSNFFTSNINDINLKKKRKLSTKKDKFNKKSNKTNNKTTPNDDIEDDLKNEEDGEDDENKEYCIHDCLVGRKYQDIEMIACDGCNNWFHPKCITMSNEEFKRFQQINWHCRECAN